MPATPHTVDIVVADMARALAFYRDLGLAIPDGAESEVQVEAHAANGWTFGFIGEAAVRQNDPDWPTPIGQRVTVAFRCDDAADVDAVYARMIAAGHDGRRAPWDSFWGQRYAFLRDPDGNRVDLFAPL